MRAGCRFGQGSHDLKGRNTPASRKVKTMSIRATVGTILPSGLLQAIFVESGGLPSELGEVLQRNIKVQAQVEELLDYGDLGAIIDSLPEGMDPPGEKSSGFKESLGEAPEHIPQLHFYEDLELWLTDAKRSSYAYLFENKQWKTYKKNWSPRGPLSPQGMPPKEMFLCHWVDENENRVTKFFEHVRYPIKVAGSVGNLPSDVEF